MREPIKLRYLKQLLRLTNHFAVLNHKVTSQALNDKPAKLDKTDDKSQPFSGVLPSFTIT